MTETTAVVIAAIISAIPTTIAIFWSYHRTTIRLVDIHSITNDRLDKALAHIKALEATVRGLRSPGSE